MVQPIGILQKDLPCIFGLGKSFRSREQTTVEAGTEVVIRFDADGWHKFVVREGRRTSTYAVATAKELDAALAVAAASSDS